MREHCYLGYKIISRIPFLAEAAEIVYSHQERYDGTGYPRGLKGDEIPLGRAHFRDRRHPGCHENRPPLPRRTIL